MAIWDITRKENPGTESFIDNLIPKGRGKALDVGCGEGFYSKYLKRKGYISYGMDLSPKMLSKANGKYDKLIRWNIEEAFPFSSNHFNIVIALEVLEHLNKPLNCIKEISRVLKQNGRAIVSVPNGTVNFEFLLQNHKHILSEKTWYKLFEPYFEIDSVKHRAIIPIVRKTVNFPQGLVFELVKK